MPDPASRRIAPQRRGDAAIRLRRALWRLDAYVTADGSEPWRRFRETFADDIDTVYRARANLDLHEYLSTANLTAAVALAERLVQCCEEAESERGGEPT